jgi:hypothetical protein
MVSAQAPFGVVKDSGFGRERGEQGLLEFTASKNVMIDFSDEKRDPFAIKTRRDQKAMIQKIAEVSTT